MRPGVPGRGGACPSSSNAFSPVALRAPCAPPLAACLASAGAPPVKGRYGARVLGFACGPRQRLRFPP